MIIDPDVDRLPAILKRAGYRTAVIGKWHLGLGGPAGPDWNGELKPGPLEIGFDQCFLLPTTNDRVPQVYVENHRVRNLDPADPLWVGDKPPSEVHPNGVSGRSTLRMDWAWFSRTTEPVEGLGYRSGNWKLVRLVKPKRRGSESGGEEFQLYDLARDPTEKTDVGGSESGNPSAVAKRTACDQENVLAVELRQARNIPNPVTLAEFGTEVEPECSGSFPAEFGGSQAGNALKPPNSWSFRGWCCNRWSTL